VLDTCGRRAAWRGASCNALAQLAPQAPPPRPPARRAHLLPARQRAQRLAREAAADAEGPQEVPRVLLPQARRDRERLLERGGVQGQVVDAVLAEEADLGAVGRAVARSKISQHRSNGVVEGGGVKAGPAS
jgi:hypothetical protein